MTKPKPHPRLQAACPLLEEAQSLLPPKNLESSIQASEKIWGAFAQAPKAYEKWRSKRAYYSLIHKLCLQYPQHKKTLENAHKTARLLRTDGFYEAIAIPPSDDIKTVRQGIKKLEEIINQYK